MSQNQTKVGYYQLGLEIGYKECLFGSVTCETTIEVTKRVSNQPIDVIIELNLSHN